jgi:hypothetical protein
MTEEEKAEIMWRAQEVLDRAAHSLAEAEERERNRDPLEEDALDRWRRLRQQSEPAPTPHATKTKRPAMSSDEKNELIAWLAMQVRGEVQRAMNAQKVELADAIGKALAEERAKYRDFVTRMLTTTEQRAAPDIGPVLDLRVERARRSGNAA